MNTPQPIRARLFYQSTCPPCQWMSKLVVLLSLGTIRRVPIAGQEARQLYRDHPAHEGQLMLRAGQRLVFGRRVFAEVPRCIVQGWWQAVRALFPFSKSYANGTRHAG